MKKIILVSALAMSLPLMVGSSFAADQLRDQTQDQLRDQDRLQDRTPIYGSQLMTPKERNEYRAKMRAAKTAKERERLRYEHHERMQARAKARGIKLPATPPVPGGGMGNGMMPGGGAGNGMGNGGGMGGGAGSGGGR